MHFSKPNTDNIPAWHSHFANSSGGWVETGKGGFDQPDVRYAELRWGIRGDSFYSTHTNLIQSNGFAFPGWAFAGPATGNFQLPVDQHYAAEPLHLMLYIGNVDGTGSAGDEIIIRPKHNFTRIRY